MGIGLYTQHLWLDPRFVGAETIARKIENELQYPGQIKVTVVRESRYVEYAK